jgi:hypothetical protein
MRMAIVNMRRLPVALIGFGAFFFSLMLQAQDIALQGFSGGSYATGPGVTAGWEFQVNHDITVTDLGFYRRGFGDSTPVGLWTVGGTLLGEVVVTLSSTLEQGFLYEPLSSGI